MKGREGKPLLARAREEKVALPPSTYRIKSQKMSNTKNARFFTLSLSKNYPGYCYTNSPIQYLIDCPMCVNLALSLVTCGIIPPNRPIVA